MKESDQYLKIVEWSEKDKCYIGSCPGLFYGGCHGDNEAKVYKELCKIVEENIALYKEDGKALPPGIASKKYSGKFMLRAGQELHQVLAIKALQTGESLNNFCVKILNKSIIHSKHSSNG
jgi:predicted HicB family RNase H-like nuclease